MATLYLDSNIVIRIIEGRAAEREALPRTW